MCIKNIQIDFINIEFGTDGSLFLIQNSDP